MGLNISKGNMYDFVTHTWNPLGGKCLHGCIYCSTNKFYYPNLIKKYCGPPRLIDNELKTNLGKGNFIFVVAQNDLFAQNIPGEWIFDILEHCNRYDNSYLFQSKNPDSIITFERYLPPKSIICTTIESNRFYSKIMNNSPKPTNRAEAMTVISCWMIKDTYLTIEPIMDFDIVPMVNLIRKFSPIQVNIGADSGNNHLPEPPKEKILQLISELEKFTKVKQKSNLERLLK